MGNAAREAWLSIFDPELRQLTLEALKEEATNVTKQAVETTRKAAEQLASAGMYAGAVAGGSVVFVGEQLLDKGQQVVEGTRKVAQELNSRFRERFLLPVQERLGSMQAFAKAKVDGLQDFYRLDRAKSKAFWAGLAERGAAGLTELVSKLQEYAAEQRGQAEALRQKVADNRAARAAIANVTNNNAT